MAKKRVYQVRVRLEIEGWMSVEAVSAEEASRTALESEPDFGTLQNKTQVDASVVEIEN